MRQYTKMSALFVCILAGLCLMGWQATSSGQWDTIALKKGIEDIGYETKLLTKEEGKETYEFKVVRGGLDIPIMAEITSSKSYIWLTVVLNTLKEGDGDVAKYRKLLQANGEIQPCQFFMNKSDRLKAAIALDNRGMTA
ncbi:MAG: hypothetical protein NT023_18625 [Armatimonadetes bacterium]|nr:hypothetical protein [Armatimonadota bacterium]